MAVMLEIHFKYSVKVREKMVMKVTSAIENKCILVRHYIMYVCIYVFQYSCLENPMDGGAW